RGKRAGVATVYLCHPRPVNGYKEKSMNGPSPTQITRGGPRDAASLSHRGFHSGRQVRKFFFTLIFRRQKAEVSQNSHGGPGQRRNDNLGGRMDGTRGKTGEQCSTHHRRSPDGAGGPQSGLRSLHFGIEFPVFETRKTTRDVPCFLPNLDGLLLLGMGNANGYCSRHPHADGQDGIRWPHTAHTTLGPIDHPRGHLYDYPFCSPLDLAGNNRDRRWFLDNLNRLCRRDTKPGATLRALAFLPGVVVIDAEQLFAAWTFELDHGDLRW